MGTLGSALAAEEITEDEFTVESIRLEIIEQVNGVASSSHFRNSKRYPALLRYIVEEALAGHAEALKERTLGIFVFDRSADYDTNLDPVVRVSAGEIRKRIAQYYQAPGHEGQLRIELPLGSYVPRFYRPTEPAHGPRRPEMHPGFRRTLAANVPEAAATARAVAIPYRDGDAPAVLPAAAPESPISAEAFVEAPVSPHTSARQARRYRLHLNIVYALLLATAAALAFFLFRSAQSARLSPGVNLFWGNILRSPEPTLIVLGVHSFDEYGNDISASSHASKPQPQETLLSAMTRSDMVHLSDLTSYGAVLQLLSSRSHGFRTQGAQDTTLEQLRGAPFVLLGGFNNLWTTRLTQQLRFRLVTLNGRRNVIQDAEHPERYWTLDSNVNALSTVQDYGVVASYLDPETGQYGIITAGIGKSGTEAATDFLTDRKGLDEWLGTVHPFTGRNVEAVVATEVIEGKHGPPHVVAYATW